MSNLKKNLLALALALMVLFAGFFSMLGGNVSVSATENNTYPPYQDGMPQKVVYISDKLEEYIGGLDSYRVIISDCLSELGWQDVPIEFHFITADSFILDLAQGDFYNIQNSAVILEFRNISLNEYYPNEIFFPKPQLLIKLETLIPIWKSNGCRVMFINHTEETLFAYNLNSPNNGDITRTPHNEFLSSVDIHINTDMFTVFADTIASKIEEDGLACNYTILLDNAYSSQKYENTFIQFLIHSLRHTCGNKEKIESLAEGKGWTITDYNDMSDQFLLNHLNIQILTYNEYYEMFENSENLDDLDIERSDDDTKLIAVGLSLAGDDLISWLEFLGEQMRKFNFEFPVYYYRDRGLSQGERDALDALPQPFSCCGWENYLKNKIPEILIDFLSGEDLGEYDNWDGKCAVTHKTGRAGPGGWLNNYCRIHDPEIEAESLSE